MKTIIFNLFIAIFLISCEKEQSEILLKSAVNTEFNADSIKRIEWRKYERTQLIIMKFLNDTVINYKRYDYQYLNTVDPELYVKNQYVSYLFKNDSLIINWNLKERKFILAGYPPYEFNGNNSYTRFKYESNRDSIKLNHMEVLMVNETYYSQKKYTTY